MIIYPAIDLFAQKAVRLYKGDYANMTVYSDNPAEIAADFKKQGATHIHLVDLEGAKSGLTPNLSTVEKIIQSTDLFAEVGGGIRSLATIEKYIAAGASRVILGTAAVQNESLILEAVRNFGDKIAVGIDCKEGFVAIHGWTETTKIPCHTFCARMEAYGVQTIICTDIAKDGAMQGTNLDLYQSLAESFSLQIIASGGVSSLSDVERLRAMQIHGAIIGKAYYTGAIDLKKAIEVAK
ncbi:MAG: 1-(5-phosphoribosyl)-5-[(5-phosphoribosylamino)methylideneamino]imidazole-4-carboxamide isomerase [Clostridia bacterium]|nr:1-(5-phosphoribosyl)-5-[(5-phosphoribosylamino)methylideneamino]imidazole-4-carboxamide isomerase [Clostridia bacterium]